jgi:hypothetical protein
MQPGIGREGLFPFRVAKTEILDQRAAVYHHKGR